jgi:hypothetical protein
MAKPEPSASANWIDAVIASGHDPRDLPAYMEDVLKHVFDFGAECGRREIQHEDKEEAPDDE